MKANVVTASFDDALKMYVANLDPKMSEGRRWAHILAFVSGMQSGTAVMQNRMSLTAMRVSEMSKEEQSKILGYLVDTCQRSHEDLQKLSENIIDVPDHGHA